MRPCCPGRRARAKATGFGRRPGMSAVEKSTGFGPPQAEAQFEDLPDALKRIAEKARPLYDRLTRYRLSI